MKKLPPTLILLAFLTACTQIHTGIDFAPFLAPSEIPATTSPLPTRTPSPLPEYVHAMPQNYTDSRLIFVGVYEMPQEIIWQDSSHFKYLINSETNNNCLTKEFQEVNILVSSDEYSIDPGDVSTLEDCYPQENIVSRSNAVQPLIFSPNRSLALIRTITSDPVAKVYLNPEDAMVNTEQYVYSVFSISTKKVIPLVSSPYKYSYWWLADGEHVALGGIAYDMIPSGGLYVIDINSYEVVTLSDTYSPGEGSVFASFSPDGKFVFLDNSLISTDGKTNYPVCNNKETGYSYTWSEDSQWGYIFCKNTSEEGLWGTLRRINTKNFEIQDDLLPTDLVIKPVSMNISPDNQWLLFDWSNGTYFSTENFGLYLVRLNN